MPNGKRSDDWPGGSRPAINDQKATGCRNDLIGLQIVIHIGDRQAINRHDEDADDSTPDSQISADKFGRDQREQSADCKPDQHGDHDILARNHVRQTANRPLHDHAAQNDKGHKVRDVIGCKAQIGRKDRADTVNRTGKNATAGCGDKTQRRNGVQFAEFHARATDRGGRGLPGQGNRHQRK